MFAVLNCACIDRNHLHRVPAIRGRAVDALTGKPIVGLTLARWFEHNVGLGPGGSEDQQVEGSVVTVTSDADGRFEFPGGHSLWGIERLEWYAYKRGYMPAGGWYRHLGDDPKDPGHATTPWPDPWVDARFAKAPGGVVMDLRVFPPTLDGVTFKAYNPTLNKLMPYTPEPADTDPWAEYLHRLDIMTQYRRIPVEEFVEEAAGYVAGNEITEEVVVQFDSLLPSGPCETDYCADPRIRQLAKAVVEYCQRTPTSPYCTLRAVFKIRRLADWLQGRKIDES